MSILNTPATTRFERRRNLTRDLLMAAAAELLVEYGYHKLTIKAITEYADVGYGTFYVHFSDKDDIVWAVVHHTAELWRKDVDDKVHQLPSPQREYQSWVMIFEYAWMMREGIVTMMGSSGSARLLQNYQNYLAAIHEENLRAGLYSAGLNLPPEFLAQYMAGAIVRLIVWWSENPNTYSPRDMANMIFEAVYRQPPPTA